jgi:hypothetical protein
MKHVRISIPTLYPIDSRSELSHCLEQGRKRKRVLFQTEEQPHLKLTELPAISSNLKLMHNFPCQLQPMLEISHLFIAPALQALRGGLEFDGQRF